MSEEEKSFSIKDRRRFDDQGNERKDEAASSTGSKSVGPKAVLGKAQKPAAKVPERVDASSGDKAVEITFSSFVVSLATQTLMQLGQIAAPPGMEIPIDRVSAKQTIDILSMLDEKTKGNLDEDEAKLIDEVLHTLRMSFVQAK